MLDTFKNTAEVLSVLLAILRFIPDAIFSYIYTRFFLEATYVQIGEKMQKKEEVRSLLDVGTSTGTPLRKIAHLFPSASILGIDYDRQYIPANKRHLPESSNVEIRHMDFNDLELKQPDSLYDAIIFQASKLILPDQTKTIELAKRKLRRGGKIYFMLTLREQKTAFDIAFDHAKPYLKYLMHANFDRVTYRRDFQNFLTTHGLNVTFNKRMESNLFLKMSKFWLYEVAKA